MRIYSLTATFGKLENETLTFQPGLNIITAENEWGKSTWCAFLEAMFYGVDTRAKSTRTTLAVKERYAPWSGRAMSGRVDLNWQGRDITIERRSKGRVPMGDFRAYETASGLELPEITAENCGELLLGVERSVFTRSGFIRFSDLNVTDDEAFRRRLNNLVTTGREDSTADHLGAELKALRNRIRYNRTGLLPQAEAELEELENLCEELKQLESRMEMAQRRIDETSDWRMNLENHIRALDYGQYQAHMEKMQQTREILEDAQAELEELNALCEAIPDRETAGKTLEELTALRDRLLQLQEQLLDMESVAPAGELASQFRDMSPAAALKKAEKDGNTHRKLLKHRHILFILGLGLAAAGLVLGMKQQELGLYCSAAGLAVMLLALIAMIRRHRKIDRLESHYGTPDAKQWQNMAWRYGEELYLHTPEAEEKRLARRQLETSVEELNARILEVTENREPEAYRETLEDVLQTWDARDEAQREFVRSREQLELLQSMVKPVDPPEAPDRLDYSRAETLRLLQECNEEHRRLEHLRGQYQGRISALGDRREREAELEVLRKRIGELEGRYQALGLALSTLNEASEELQRRFAPRISRRARELMARMTGGRYDRLSLNRDLSIQAGAERENVVREALWRSDGTVDQLYLCLRLAVARELTPELPLILDDALVRFDDKRLKAALDILKEESREKQVILFTCQNREKNMES